MQCVRCAKRCRDHSKINILCWCARCRSNCAASIRREKWFRQSTVGWSWAIFTFYIHIFLFIFFSFSLSFLPLLISFVFATLNGACERARKRELGHAMMVFTSLNDLRDWIILTVAKKHSNNNKKMYWKQNRNHTKMCSKSASVAAATSNHNIHNNKCAEKEKETERKRNIIIKKITWKFCLHTLFAPSNNHIKLWILL